MDDAPASPTNFQDTIANYFQQLDKTNPKTIQQIPKHNRSHTEQQNIDDSSGAELR